jgi:4-amino-4-deoxy-L-arabinose transferase-like glycosyltransferase
MTTTERPAEEQTAHAGGKSRPWRFFSRRDPQSAQPADVFHGLLDAITPRRGLVITLVASVITLAAGFSSAPFWDEDETRFVAIAQSMLDSGDWVVPRYNGTLAVDKPVLMHWSIASSFALFGRSEVAARLPAAIATLLTAVAVFRAGASWFGPATGLVAALAYVGSLLVAIEGHAATPDAILVACLTWTTLLAAEGLMPGLHSRGRPGQSEQTATRLASLSPGRALAIGGITGLAVLCKGPVGFVGPLAVIGLWCWWAAIDEELLRGPRGSTLGGLAAGAARLAVTTARRMRPLLLAIGMLAVAGPWYAAVTIRTGGAWPEGFFLVHNLHRFAEPMENHVGGVLFHPITMLALFYPWSCWLPLAMVVATWRAWQHRVQGPQRAALVLLLTSIVVWVGTFSVAATKLPNYVLPAYPAAAMLVAAMAVEACRRPSWPHPRWLATGTAALGFGGIVLAAVVLVAVQFGAPGGELVAAVGIIPLTAAVIVWRLRHRPVAAVAAVSLTGLVFTAVAVGPAATRVGQANTLPGLVETAVARSSGPVRLGGYHQTAPSIVCYARDTVAHWTTPEDCLEFLASTPEAHVLVAADRFDELEERLPEGVGVVARARPLFRETDVLLVGHRQSRTAELPDPHDSPKRR